jgi:hypothetical protein
VEAELSIPRPAGLYILLQRTAYQSPLLARLLRRAPGRASLAYARLEAAVRRSRIEDRYRRGIQRDFRSIAPSLPSSAQAILDIGCGLAGIDILLSRHFAAPSPPDLYLSDFEHTDSRILYDFGPAHAHYNSLTLAQQFLLLNDVPPETIRMLHPDEIAGTDDGRRFDLVISTLAWGFHFPVETYADAISSRMTEQGRLILDVRVGTNGVEALRKTFPRVQVIEENETRRRVLAAR